MQKILIITLEYPPEVGGIASYVFNFAAQLPPEQVVVMAPPSSGDGAFDGAHPWKVYRRRPYWFFMWPRWLRLLWSAWRTVKREGITELYIHHALPVGYIGWLINRLTRVPYTLFVHGTDVALIQAHRWKRRLLRLVGGRARELVANSQFLAARLKETLGTNSPSVSVVYPCPGEMFLQPAPPADIAKLRSELALGGKKVIISVGRLADGKGFPHLARALVKVTEVISNVVWLIIGDGSKRADLLNYIQKNSLQNIVRYIGPVPYNHLPLYYQAADVFALLTHQDETAAEGWGTVFLEAAASGLPVVAGRAGGVEEAVEHLVTGLVVDVYQPNAVAGALVELLKNPSYAKQMGAAGRARVEREFRWEKQIKKVISNIVILNAVKDPRSSDLK